MRTILLGVMGFLLLVGGLLVIASFLGETLNIVILVVGVQMISMAIGFSCFPPPPEAPETTETTAPPQLFRARRDSLYNDPV